MLMFSKSPKQSLVGCVVVRAGRGVGRAEAQAGLLGQEVPHASTGHSGNT